jgi:hypothetical protein
MYSVYIKYVCIWNWTTASFLERENSYSRKNARKSLPRKSSETISLKMFLFCSPTLKFSRRQQGLPDGIFSNRKNPNLGKFWRVLLHKMLVYLSPFGIFYGHLVNFMYGHLVYFMVICQMLWVFDIFPCYLVYFPPFLECRSKTNLATLRQSSTYLVLHVIVCDSILFFLIWFYTKLFPLSYLFVLLSLYSSFCFFSQFNQHLSVYRDNKMMDEFYMPAIKGSEKPISAKHRLG